MLLYYFLVSAHLHPSYPNTLTQFPSGGPVNLPTINILSQIILHNCSVHCRLLSSIPGLYPLDATNIPSVVKTLKCLRTLPNVLQRTKIIPGREPLFWTFPALINCLGPLSSNSLFYFSSSHLPRPHIKFIYFSNPNLVAHWESTNHGVNIY